MHSVTKVHTTLELSEADFEWTIENWSRKSMVYNELCSQEFQLLEIGKICFLRIVDYKQSTGYIHFIVDLEKCNALQKAAVKVHSLDVQNQKINLTHYQKVDITRDKTTFISFHYYVNETCVKDDSLTIFIEISYIREYSEVKGLISKYTGVAKSYTKMMILDNYDELYKNQELCDVTFLIDKEEVKAHIAILASASTYFRAMFTHDNMKENKKKVVDFTEDTDVTVKNFKIFLDCIYGCKNVAELDEIVSEILVLADKFGVKRLQESCELYLSDMLNENNVAKFLLFAEKYHCVALRERALTFAKTNINVVKKSDEFGELCKMEELIRQLL